MTDCATALCQYFRRKSIIRTTNLGRGNFGRGKLKQILVEERLYPAGVKLPIDSSAAKGKLTASTAVFGARQPIKT